MEGEEVELTERAKDVHDSFEGYFLVWDDELFFLDVEGFDDDMMGICFDFGLGDEFVEIGIKIEIFGFKL